MVFVGHHNVDLHLMGHGSYGYVDLQINTQYNKSNTKKLIKYIIIYIKDTFNFKVTKFLLDKKSSSQNDLVGSWDKALLSESHSIT